MLEQNMRQPLMMFNGSITILVYRLICTVCLGVAALLVLSAFVNITKKKRLKPVGET